MDQKLSGIPHREWPWPLTKWLNKQNGSSTFNDQPVYLSNIYDFQGHNDLDLGPCDFRNNRDQQLLLVMTNFPTKSENWGLKHSKVIDKK